MNTSTDPVAYLDQLLNGSDTDIIEADNQLSKLGLARGLHDTLAVHRALIAHRLGDIPRAVAEAQRSVWLFPNRSEPRLFLAYLLEQQGAESLSLQHLSKAIEDDPRDLSLQHYYLQRLMSHSPEVARKQLVSLLPYVSITDAPALVALVADQLNDIQLGAAWRENNQVQGWIASHEPLEICSWRGDDWTTAPVPLTATNAGIATFALSWPHGAEGVIIRNVAKQTVLAGTPLVVPDYPLLREPQQAGILHGQQAVLTDALVKNPTSITDVIVPVYAGLEVLRSCLESVFDSEVKTAFELIVIDDASPDLAIRAYIEQLAAEKKITLIRNPVNLGFTASVNRGMVLHSERDVVLLNADTLVCEGWLDRIRQAALSAPTIGTVTPLTNNGQLVSYPVPTKANPMLSPTEIQRVDQLAKQLNAGAIVDLPTGIGFCLYIRRPCLEAAGYFDTDQFGRGYGEETDFCLRAAAKGWRNVCAADVYIGHQGSVSFGQEKATLVGYNMPKVAALHPEYKILCGRFLLDDPLAPYRRNLERAALSPMPGQTVVAIGPQDWRDDPTLRRYRFEAGTKGIWLYWLSLDVRNSQPIVNLEGERPWGPGSLSYRLPEEGHHLCADLERLGVQELHWYSVPNRLIQQALVSYSAHHRLFVNSRDMLAYVLDRTQLPEIIEADRLQVVVASQFARNEVADKRPDLPLALDLLSTRTTQADWSGLPNKIAVIVASQTQEMHLRLLKLLRFAAASEYRLQFYLFGSSFDDLALTRTQQVIVMGEVPLEERAPLAQSLGCRVALCLGHDFDPLGQLVDLGAQTAQQLLVVAGGACAERAELYSCAKVVPIDTSEDWLLKELWTLSQ